MWWGCPEGGGYTLQTAERKELAICEVIEESVRSLPAIIDGESGEVKEREVEAWVPVKKVKMWSPRTERVGTRTVRYGGGGWVFFRTVMDEAVDKLIKENFLVRNYRFYRTINQVAAASMSLVGRYHDLCSM